MHRTSTQELDTINKSLGTTLSIRKESMRPSSFGALRDSVSLHNKILNKVKTQANMYHALIEMMPHAILVCKGFEVVKVNDRFLQLSNLLNDDVIGSNICSLISCPNLSGSENSIDGIYRQCNLAGFSKSITMHIKTFGTNGSSYRLVLILED